MVFLHSHGPLFYRAMGAQTHPLPSPHHSGIVFGGAILIWVFNLLLAACAVPAIFLCR